MKESKFLGTLLPSHPDLIPIIQAMREKLASVMQIEIDCVSIKATTNEKMGFVGREEGVAAYAVALINRQ